MDIFDVLTAISEKKTNFMQSGMNEQEAMLKANLDISREYHIPLLDIKKLFPSSGSAVHRPNEALAY